MRTCRPHLAAASVLAAFVAAPALADPAKPAPAAHAALPHAPASSAPASPAENPALVFYPPAARAAGVEGQAKISCARNAHLALKDCKLVSESPAGQGFGAAALAMAAKATDNLKIDNPELATRPPAEIEINFGLHPPGIAPDVTGVAHLITQSSIVTKPTDAQVQAAYPTRAQSDQIRGGAAIECVVTVAGALTECHVAGEAPSGYGFGQAALDLAADYKMKPRAIDGDPVGGAQVRITVTFSPNDPSAPLSLDTKPAP
ncbi:MAG TPA: energy transducer TonB [Caulobacteraceae bacterium]|jgi:TonB family protein